MVQGSTCLPCSRRGILWTAWTGLRSPPSRLLCYFHFLYRPVRRPSFQKIALLRLCSQAVVFLYPSHSCLRFHSQNPCRHVLGCVARSIIACIVRTKLLCPPMFMTFPSFYFILWGHVLLLSECCQPSLGSTLLPMIALLLIPLFRLILLAKASLCGPMISSFVCISPLSFWRHRRDPPHSYITQTTTRCYWTSFSWYGWWHIVK